MRHIILLCVASLAACGDNTATGEVAIRVDLADTLDGTCGSITGGELHTGECGGGVSVVMPPDFVLTDIDIEMSGAEMRAYASDSAPARLVPFTGVWPVDSTSARLVLAPTNVQHPDRLVHTTITSLTLIGSYVPSRAPCHTRSSTCNR